MAMRKMKIVPMLALVVMALLSGCMALGIAPAKTASSRYAYGVAMVTAVQTVTAKAVKAGAMPKPVGEDVLRHTDAAMVLLNASLDLSLADKGEKMHKEALGVLAAAMEILKGYGVAL